MLKYVRETCLRWLKSSFTLKEQTIFNAISQLYIQIFSDHPSSRLKDSWIFAIWPLTDINLIRLNIRYPRFTHNVTHRAWYFCEHILIGLLWHIISKMLSWPVCLMQLICNGEKIIPLKIIMGEKALNAKQRTRISHWFNREQLMNTLVGVLIYI